MPSSKPVTQLPPESRTHDVCYRVAVIARGEADDEGRSFPIVLATETPVRTYDFARMEVVDEVLRVDGLQFPSQVPLVDSHDTATVRNVLGSIRELKVQDGQLVGRAYFAADDVSRNVFQNYMDGHLTDFSVTVRRLESTYEGAKKIVLRSALIEGSAVVRGADPNAKALLAQRAYTDPEGLRKEIMDKKLRELLVSRGLAADANDADTLAFLQKELQRSGHGIDAKLALEAVAKLGGNNPDDKPNADEVVRAERQRVQYIDEACRQHSIDDVTRRKWIDEGASADAVARDIVKRLATARDPLADVRVGKEAGEKLYDACSAALMQRFLKSAGKTPRGLMESCKARGDFDAVKRAEKLVEQAEKTPGAADFRFASICDIAARFLESGSESTRGTRSDVIRRAIDRGDYLSRAAYHTTGSFSHLMLDAQNKLLLAAFDDEPSTYSIWVRTAPSTPDFKTMHRIRFGELPNPQAVPENAPYNDSITSDTRESYAPVKYGDVFSVTLEAMVNDDLNALTRVPAMQGAAMRRLINKSCYAVLTSNPTMSDGLTLFHASGHNGNLDTTPLSEAALDVGFVVMMTQTGLTGDAVLNIKPRYLLCAPAIHSTALRIVDPRKWPTGSAGVSLYSTDGQMPLVVVTDAEISASQSATAWYLAADPSRVDTVELCFLQGEETPVLEREYGFINDSMRFKVRQTFGVKAIDYRGLYQGNT